RGDEVAQKVSRIECAHSGCRPRGSTPWLAQNSLAQIDARQLLLVAHIESAVGKGDVSAAGAGLEQADACSLAVGRRRGRHDVQVAFLGEQDQAASARIIEPLPKSSFSHLTFFVFSSKQRNVGAMRESTRPSKP